MDIDTIKGIDRKIWHDYARAKALLHRQNHNESKQLIDRLLIETEDHHSLFERAKLLQLRGLISSLRNQRQPAAEDFYKTADIYVQLELFNEAVNCYLSIVNLHVNSNNYQLAIENGYRAVEFLKKSTSLTHSDSSTLMSLYNTIGLGFHQIHQADSAMKYFESSLTIATRLKSDIWKGLIGGNMSRIYVSKGRLNEALELLNVDIKVSLHNRELVSAANALILKGEIYALMKKPFVARHYYDSSYLLIQQERDPQPLRHYYKMMANFYRTQNDFRRADEYFQKFVALRDSLRESRPSKQLQEIQNRNHQEKQLAGINLLRIENEHKKRELRLWQLCIVATICALALLLVLFYNNRKNNVLLTKLNLDLENRVKIRTSELIQTNKDLDTYLYRASHDVRRPILTIIGLTQIAELSVSEAERADIRKKTITTAQQMDKMLCKLQMAYELNTPVQLQPLNLYSYLSELSQGLNRQYPLAQFQIKKSGDIVLTTDAKLLNMVFMNIVENACVFSKTDLSNGIDVKIDIEGSNDHISVKVKDNGIGIDEKNLNQIFDAYTRFSEQSIGSGIGLYIVKKALLKLGGIVSVISKSAEGSLFIVHIPRRVEIPS